MKVLTQEQARALHAAMLDCNDVGATFCFKVGHIDGFLIVVEEDIESWGVNVKLSDGTIVETYENQAAFAMEYGLPI